MNFFKRILNLFRRKEEPVVMSQPPVTPPTILDPNYEAWKLYQANLKETGVFPTAPAAERSNVIPQQYLGETKTYEQYLKEKYGQVPTFGRDLTPEEVAATASKPTHEDLPEPPNFHFLGDSPEEKKFNELKAKSQQEAYRYLLQQKWNTLGTKFREQAAQAGINPDDINRIINTYSSGGGGSYFKQ